MTIVRIFSWMFDKYLYKYTLNFVVYFDEPQNPTKKTYI